MIGHIDLLDDGVLHGWHVAVAEGPVVIKIDGKFAGLAHGGIRRPDVAAAGFADAACGFRFEIPRSYQDGQPHEIELSGLGWDALGLVKARHVIGRNEQLAVPRVGRAAVVCWDLAHNPAGRAIVLARLLEKIYGKVDLIGPLHPEHGRSVWAPIRNERGITFITQKYEGVGTYDQLADKACRNTYDFIYICKPRWPSIYIAKSIIERQQCAFALDADDHELSFFPAKFDGAVPNFQEIPALVTAGKITPFGHEATLCCDSLIQQFPLRTVSNPSLAQKYGGAIVPHARDADLFDPSNFSRDICRQALGYGDRDKVVLFSGTVRAHKGVVELAKAMARVRSKNLKLCIFGDIKEKSLRGELRAILGDRLAVHEGGAMSQLPAINLAADLVCLLQDPNSVISEFQFPAKFFDAIGMGTPVLIPDLPPFRDVLNFPGVHVLTDGSIGHQIANVLKTKSDRDVVRNGFLAHYSTLEVSKTLRQGIESVFSGSSWTDVVKQSGLQKIFTKHTPEPARSTFAIGYGSGPDVVFLWKQNDSGLFGRRADMISKYLVDTDCAGRVLHIEQSIELSKVQHMASTATSQNSNKLIYNNVLSRWLELDDDYRRFNRTFVVDDERRQFGGKSTIHPADLGDAYQESLKNMNVSGEAILWICPVFFDIKHVLNSSTFSLIISDIIDDQREGTQSTKFRKILDQNYSACLSVSELVIANCRGVIDGFADRLRTKVILASNAAEDLSVLKAERAARPERDGPKIIGYVGNLRDRIDVPLIERLSKEFPQHEILLCGPTGGNASVEQLSLLRNVTLTGPVPNRDAVKIMSHFDVAIIPHTIDTLTGTMNPLKAYSYSALGLPIVSTGVANLDDLSGIHFAKNAENFCGIVGNLLSKRPITRPIEGRKFYWPDTVKAIWKNIDPVR